MCSWPAVHWQQSAARYVHAPCPASQWRHVRNRAANARSVRKKSGLVLPVTARSRHTPAWQCAGAVAHVHAPLCNATARLCRRGADCIAFFFASPPPRDGTADIILLLLVGGSTGGLYASGWQHPKRRPMPKDQGYNHRKYVAACKPNAFSTVLARPPCCYVCRAADLCTSSMLDSVARLLHKLGLSRYVPITVQTGKKTNTHIMSGNNFVVLRTPNALLQGHGPDRTHRG